MASNKQVYKANLELPGQMISEKEKKKSRGKIIAKAESVGDSNNEVILQIDAVLKPMRGCICREIDYPYLLIERASSSLPEKFAEGIT